MVIITKTDSRPLVQWLHQGNPYLLGKVVRDGPIGAVAVSAARAARMETTIAAASELGFGVVVDSEPHRVQLAEDHPLRSGGYRAAGLEWTRLSFDPDTMELGEEGRSELTALHRDTQAGHGATVFLCTGHRVRDEAPLSPGRRRELQLAGDFLALARASGASHPSPQSGAPRHIAVGLSVDAREVGSRISSELADAYSELSPDLFWLNCWNFSGGAAQYEGIRFLARRLQRLSGGIPCLVAGIGPLWEAALRNQIAAVCQGWGRRSFDVSAAADAASRGAQHALRRAGVPSGDSRGRARWAKVRGGVAGTLRSPSMPVQPSRPDRATAESARKAPAQPLLGGGAGGERRRR